MAARAQRRRAGRQRLRSDLARRAREAAADHRRRMHTALCLSVASGLMLAVALVWLLRQ